MFEGVGLNDLWGGGWGEFVDEDADQIGDAYEAAIVGGIVGVDDEDEAGSVVPSPLGDSSQTREELQ